LSFTKLENNVNDLNRQSNTRPTDAINAAMLEAELALIDLMRNRRSLRSVRPAPDGLPPQRFDTSGLPDAICAACGAQFSPNPWFGHGAGRAFDDHVCPAAER
jgi:hypothetical protein